MNVFNEHPFKVLFDYGHNAHAVGAMADLAQRLDVTGRRIVVLAGPGDRRDEDLRAIADAVAGRFDHYICRRDDSLRDRGPDEVPKLQAAQLQLRGVPAAAISIIPDEQEAIEAALNMGQRGRPAARVRGRADPLVEADHQVQVRHLTRHGCGRGRAGRQRGEFRHRRLHGRRTRTGRHRAHASGRPAARRRRRCPQGAHPAGPSCREPIEPGRHAAAAAREARTS